MLSVFTKELSQIFRNMREAIFSLNPGLLKAHARRELLPEIHDGEAPPGQRRAGGGPLAPCWALHLVLQ